VLAVGQVGGERQTRQVGGAAKRSGDATHGDLTLGRYGCWRMLWGEAEAQIGNAG
jgi:hypothetical protein